VGLVEQPGEVPRVLWVGTPAGALAEVDLDDQHVVTHDALAGAPVTALAATAAGELVAATGAGDLALSSVLTGSTKAPAADSDTARAAVTAFLDATCEVPGDGELETHLVISDGTRTWEPDDLAAVITATAADPAGCNFKPPSTMRAAKRSDRIELVTPPSLADFTCQRRGSVRGGGDRR
jgi:hypothetical protein